MLTRQFSYVKGQEFSIFYFFSEIVTWHEGIGIFRFKSSFKGHTVDFKMCYVIIILYRLSVMLYGEGNICHSITLVCLQTNRKQPGGKHVRIVKKRLRIFNKIAFGGQSWANIFRFFIILADGIRWNKIVHGITVPFICAFLSIQCAKQNIVAWNLVHKCLR